MEMGWGRRRSLASSVLGKCRVPGLVSRFPGALISTLGGCLLVRPHYPVPASESDSLEPSQLLVQQGSPGLGRPHLAFCTPTSPGSICVYSVTQSCPTLSDPMDCSPPGSSVHGILQARVLQWGALPSFRGSSCPRDRTRVSCVSCIG